MILIFWPLISGAGLETLIAGTGNNLFYVSRGFPAHHDWRQRDEHASRRLFSTINTISNPLDMVAAGCRIYDLAGKAPRQPDGFRALARAATMSA